jgi:predicted MFS family arabinose efflux permease
MQTASAPGQAPKLKFTGYQLFILAIIAFIQFTVVLDFMVMAPMGAILMPELGITPRQFSIAVSAYSVSAFVGSFCASFLADRFDRKRFLLFFYGGFVLGTLLCGLAPGYHALVGARIFTGIFGGVISSISSAIITDLFAPQQRGRVMGIVQMAFGVSQVVGIPVGLVLADRWDWHMPFLMIVGIAIPVGVMIMLFMKPVAAHLQLQASTTQWQKVKTTFGTPIYLLAYFTTALLPLGGYMLMPFSSAFLQFNLGVSDAELPIVFLVSGLFSMVTGPLIGWLSDKVGRYRMFVVGSLLSMVMVVIFTTLGPSPLAMVIVINVILYMGVTGRIIPAMAINSMVPNPADRGAFMSINSSLQQLSGGIGAMVSGLIVTRANDHSPLVHFDWVGYITAAIMVLTLMMMFLVNREVAAKSKQQAEAPKA